MVQPPPFFLIIKEKKLWFGGVRPRSQKKKKVSFLEGPRGGGGQGQLCVCWEGSDFLLHCSSGDVTARLLIRHMGTCGSLWEKACNVKRGGQLKNDDDNNKKGNNKATPHISSILRDLCPPGTKEVALHRCTSATYWVLRTVKRPRRGLLAVCPQPLPPLPWVGVGGSPRDSRRVQLKESS